MKSSIKAQRFLTTVTLCATFLLGYLNAYSYVFNQSSYITPQTGNLISLGVALVREDTQTTILNFMLLVGFALGCIIGGILLVKVKINHRCLVFTWSVFTAMLMVVYLLNDGLSQPVSVILLALLSGFALTLFRKVGQFDVNNGIMTGNFKNLYVNLVQGFSKNSWPQIMKAFAFLLVIVVFFLGCLLGGYLSNFGEKITLIVSFLICLVPYFSLI